LALASNERQALSGLITPSRANPALASALPRKLAAPTMAWPQSPCPSAVTAACSAVAPEEQAVRYVAEGPSRLKASDSWFSGMSGLLMNTPVRLSRSPA
jgi:hypothetical protein